MKTSAKVRCAYCHDAIETKHVFTQNNQVYLKCHEQEQQPFENQWSAINFQWIPVLQMKEHLENL